MQSMHYAAELPAETPMRVQPEREKKNKVKVQTIYDWAANEAANPQQKAQQKNSKSRMDVDEAEPTQYGVPDNKFNLKPEQVKVLIWVEANEKDEEINCDSCLDDYYDKEKRDDLVICEKCNVAVH